MNIEQSVYVPAVQRDVTPGMGIELLYCDNFGNPDIVEAAVLSTFYVLIQICVQ